MTAELVGHFAAGSAEWHAARADGLGGSEVAPLLGLSPYESEFSLFHKKTGAYVEAVVNDEMEAGTRLEPVIVQWFADQHPEFGVVRPAGTWRSVERPWQVANPDAFVYAGGVRSLPASLLEVKFALYDDAWGEPGTDEIPIWYRCQVQHYLDVFDLEVCYVAVFIGSCAEFREYVVRADDDDKARLRAVGEAFLARVAAGERPDIDGHSATYEVVRSMHPEIDPVSVPVPAEIAVPFFAAKAEEKVAVAEARRATAVLADLMGRAQRAEFNGKRIAGRQSKGGGVPYVVAARNLPTPGASTDLEVKAS